MNLEYRLDLDMKKALNKMKIGLLAPFLWASNVDVNKQEQINSQSGPLASYAVNAGFGGADAHAARIVEEKKKKIVIPKAITMSPDKALAPALGFGLSKGSSAIYKTESGDDVPDKVIARRILRMGNGQAPSYINEKTPTLLPEYCLVTMRTGNFPGTRWVNDNLSSDETRSLFHYCNGLVDFFDNHREKHAKVDFAKGMFVAAELGPKEYQIMNNLGIHIKYNDSLSLIGNAEVLGTRFVELSVDDQIKITDKVILPKFKNVKITGKFVDSDTMEYKAKMIHYNFGFWIMSEYDYNMKNAKRLDREENKNGLYSNLYDVFGYDTVTSKLIK